MANNLEVYLRIAHKNRVLAGLGCINLSRWTGLNNTVSPHFLVFYKQIEWKYYPQMLF